MDIAHFLSRISRVGICTPRMWHGQGNYIKVLYQGWGYMLEWQLIINVLALFVTNYSGIAPCFESSNAMNSMCVHCQARLEFSFQVWVFQWVHTQECCGRWMTFTQFPPACWYLRPQLKILITTFGERSLLRMRYDFRKVSSSHQPSMPSKLNKY